jgi:hypothetical protein
MLLLRVSSEITEKCGRNSIRSSRCVQLVWSLLAAACTNPHFADGESPDAQGIKGELPADAASDRDARAPQEAGTSESEGSKVSSEAGSASLRNDAAVPSQPTDAGMQSDQVDAAVAAQKPAFPSWATPLLGTYAVQAHSFSFDNFANLVKAISRLEEISLVHIERVGETTEMRSKLCIYAAQGQNDDLRMTDPSGLPEVRRALAFGEDKSWTTDALPWGIGYSREVPTECIGKENQQVARRPGQQAWLTGSTCLCPSSAQVGPRVDDCRVSDPDNDGKPGLTFTMKGRGAYLAILNEEFQAVLIDRAHVIGGRVDDSGTNHFGNRVMDGIAYQFPCATSNCSLVSDVARPCTSEHNGVRFHKLEKLEGDAEWTCEKIVADVAKLFPMPIPSSPTACSQQVLTDDPNRR